MRRIIRSAALLGICLVSILSAAHADKTTTVTTMTVQRYDGGTGLPDCNSSGTGCTITITKTVVTESIIAPTGGGGGGLVLQVPHTDMTGTVPRMTGPLTIPLANRAITFPPTTTVTIDDSPTYPALNGRVLNISGIATDVNGGYTVLFMP